LTDAQLAELIANRSFLEIRENERYRSDAPVAIHETMESLIAILPTPSTLGFAMLTANLYGA
jgi:hypothetical protein